MQRLLQDCLQDIPASLQGVKAEIAQWLKLAFTSKMKTLDFVTREEFDIQLEVLQRAQQRCRQLEIQLESLSAKVNDRSKNLE